MKATEEGNHIPITLIHIIANINTVSGNWILLHCAQVEFKPEMPEFFNGSIIANEVIHFINELKEKSNRFRGKSKGKLKMLTIMLTL